MLSKERIIYLVRLTSLSTALYKCHLKYIYQQSNHYIDLYTFTYRYMYSEQNAQMF